MGIAKHVAVLISLTLPTTAWAAERLPERVIQFFDAGAGPIAGPYGGTNDAWPVSGTADFFISSTPNNGSRTPRAIVARAERLRVLELSLSELPMQVVIAPGKRRYISTFRWITSDDELNRRNGEVGLALNLRGIDGVYHQRPRAATLV